MSHSISGIITSFKYQGDLPNTVLVGNYFMIPVNRKRGANYSDTPLVPYDDYTPETKKLLRELSFTGPCAYVETDFFVEGIQRAEVWRDGTLETGPLISFHGYAGDRLRRLEEEHSAHEVVDAAINTCLRDIGIYCHEGMDEFDSARLGWYRSNEEFLTPEE